MRGEQVLEVNNIVAEVCGIYHLENWMDDKAYHNAKELLKVYSNVVWSLNQNVEELKAEAKEFSNSELINYINCLMDIDTKVNKEHFQNRLRTVAETNCMVELVDRSLLKLRNYPKTGERYFDIINKCYLLKYKYSESEVLEALDITRATFYREKKKAVTLLGVILWGFVIPEILMSMRKSDVKYETGLILK